MMLIKKLILPAFLFFWSMPEAGAHAVLMYSMPAISGHVAAGPLVINLRFNSLIDAKRSRVSLVDAAGQEHVLPTGPDAAGDALHAEFAVAPGPNLLHWQVLAVDGHITRGNVPFDAAPVSPSLGRSPQGR